MRPAPLHIPHVDVVEGGGPRTPSTLRARGLVTPKRAQHEHKIREEIIGMYRIQHMKAFMLVDEVSCLSSSVCSRLVFIRSYP